MLAPTSSRLTPVDVFSNQIPKNTFPGLELVLAPPIIIYPSLTSAGHKAFVRPSVTPWLVIHRLYQGMLVSQ